MPVRVRTMGEIQTKTGNYKEVAFNGNIITNTDVMYPSLSSGEFSKMTDVITPRYRHKSSSGSIVNNPMHRYTYRATPGSYGFQARRNSGSGNTVQYFIGEGPYAEVGFGERPSVDVEALRAEAGTRAAAGVDKPVVDGLVEAAEWHKTMDLLKVRSDFLSRKLQYILSKSGRRPGKFGRAVGVIGQGWLIYRYGIMPIVHSMDSLLQDWNGRITTTRRTSRGSASGSTSSSNTISNNSGFFWNVTAHNSHELSYDVRAGVLYEQYAQSNRYGFNPQDLPAAAWELVPYSFVIDWFANAGDFIRAWTPKVGVRTLATWTTVKTTHQMTQSISSTWKSPSGFSSVQAPSGTRSWLTEATDRTPGISKALTLRESSVSPILTSKRVIDSFFLAFNLVRR